MAILMRPAEPPALSVAEADEVAPEQPVSSRLHAVARAARRGDLSVAEDRETGTEVFMRAAPRCAAEQKDGASGADARGGHRRETCVGSEPTVCDRRQSSEQPPGVRCRCRIVIQYVCGTDQHG
ncbi:hypothetical protein GCM10010269_05790 [Streptomyces humidus]|uniref:Uncharacterized protein n=1 Tax=Streptomyces humidus TaxID=52259 RepID=A0A918FQW7_9ACTN|nr:hypothetical protein GCM10010269_05790 [Streptomyces humidus]